MNKCIWALDISIANSGIVIFNSNDTNIRNPILITSIETNPKDDVGRRLKTIADFVIPLKSKYPPIEVATERGFYRYNRSTQVIYMVHGLFRYLLWDVKHYLYPPTKIKKFITGKGNSKKICVRDSIREKYGNVFHFSNFDESDAFAVAVYHINNGRGENKHGS